LKINGKAQVLIEALPYIRAFFGKTIIIKYGGAAMTDPVLKHQFAEDVVLMKYVGMNPMIVHGGGPQISEMMKRLGRAPQFVDGVRVTDAATMEIVEMVLGGTLNKEIVTLIHRHGGRAVGLTGKDGGLIRARPLRHGKGDGTVEHTGAVAAIDPAILLTLSQFIPVIAPVGADAEGKSYNINADSAAGSLAAALCAEKVLFLTDVPGILEGREAGGSGGQLISTLSRKEAQRLIKTGVISHGMLPKVEAALSAVAQGVHKAHIIDGRVPHALLLEIFTDQGVGTEIVA
jgi:acetylglutamate kinase